MTVERAREASIPDINEETAALVRLSAIITAGSEDDLRREMTAAARSVRPEWVEELLLQSYLFCGFPRALNATREWRKASGRAAPANDEGTQYEHVQEWDARGQQTCSTVYGRMYEGLRTNIRALHPALDSWMIVEGYGKVLSRPGLDLVRRELCIIAACAAGNQMRQLHSHLHGAVNAGARIAQVDGALAAIDDLVSRDVMTAARQLWMKVSSAEWGSRQ